MSSRARRFTCLLLPLAAASGALPGCESRDAELRGNLTPELLTLHQRPVDSDNSIAITFDENGRMFWQDLGRAFYWDRPSRLTREPIPR